ncbi:MAG: discoidin domain-containing protein [Chitinophagaceae bacterium]|nr:discoidin domain-containing protein [Chitinophagaceae bacterium]
MKHFLSNVLGTLFLLSVTSVSAQTCDMYVAGYVPSYRPAGSIDYSKLSALFYGFAGSSSTGTLIVDSSINGNLTAFKNATAGKKRYLSLEGGGYQPNTLKNIAGNSSLRSAFASSCVSFCTSNGFDGIDMDWENIDNATDSTNFHALVSALSTALHANGLKFVITLSYNYNARFYGVASLNTADWIQLMVYDETGWGAGSPYANHSSYESMENAVSYWVNKGYTDRSKIVIGLPFFGYQFASYAGGVGTAKTYNEIATNTPGLKTDVDTIPLTFFNSAAMLKRKVDHVKFTGLKGVFIWELGQDLPSSDTRSLLRAVSDAACDQNPFWSDYSQSPGSNLALNTPVESSSGSTNVTLMVDNDISTYWTSSSANGDTAWIHVDLGSNYDISKVEIVWDKNGVGRDFEIKVAPTTNGPWQKIQQRFYNSSLTTTLTGLKGIGRFVSIQGVSRGCASKYKVAEMRVYGTPYSGNLTSKSSSPVSINPVLTEQKNERTKVYPNPASNSLIIDMSQDRTPVDRIELINNLGTTLKVRSVHSIGSIETIDTSSYPAGVYLIKMVSQNKKTGLFRVLIQH